MPQPFSERFDPMRPAPNLAAARHLVAQQGRLGQRLGKTQVGRPFQKVMEKGTRLCAGGKIVQGYRFRHTLECW